MPITIIEIKARSTQHESVRKILMDAGADYKGKDQQIDTYFNVRNGRLKLREGTIENNLIHYERANQKGPKQSSVLLYRSKPESSLKRILETSLGVLSIVDKQREIYYIDNIKFHIDTVKDLGTFIEIEAIDEDGSIPKDQLQIQCERYLERFDIKEEDLINCSYSDLLLDR